MNDKERIAILREGWSESISALGKCKIFLTALIDHPFLAHNPHQIRELLNDVQFASKIAERDFKTENINPED